MLKDVAQGCFFVKELNCLSDLKKTPQKKANLRQKIKCNFNPLPNNKSLDMTKLKPFADHKLNITISLSDLSFFFSQCFQKPSSLRLLKVGIV